MDAAIAQLRAASYVKCCTDRAIRDRRVIVVHVQRATGAVDNYLAEVPPVAVDSLAAPTVACADGLAVCAGVLCGAAGAVLAPPPQAVRVDKSEHSRADD